MEQYYISNLDISQINNMEVSELGALEMVYDPIRYSHRRSNIDISTSGFIPTFTNSGSITLDQASINTIGDYREVNILFSSFDTDLSTDITIPTGLFRSVQSIHSSRNIVNNSTGIFATINYNFSVITIDRDDNINTNSPLSLSIAGRISDGIPINAAPVIDAGIDNSGVTGSPLSLDGTVSDDGLPNPPGTLTTTWSQISGPGTATFGDSGVVDTTVTFDATGIYVLRLTGDDGALSTTDDLTFTATGIIDPNVAPSVNAGADDSLSNIFMEDFNTDGLNTDIWSTIDPSGDVTFSVTGNILNISLPAGTSHDLYTVPRNAARVVHNSLDEDFQFGATFHSVPDTNAQIHGLYIEQDSDNMLRFNLGHSTFTFQQGIDIVAGIGSSTTTSASGVTGKVDMRVTRTNDNFLFEYAITGGPWISGNARNIPMTVNKVGLIGINYNTNPAFDIIIDNFYSNCLESGVPYSLTGSVSDDGLPASPGVTTTTWSKLSGPGTVLFADSGNVETTAYFSDTGVYTLRLSADDGQLISTDDVIITVTGT